MSKIKNAVAAPCLLLVVAAVFPLRAAEPEAKPYVLTRTLDVGGDGGWDYVTVDAEHGLIFLPRGKHTVVIDAKSGKTVADIPGQAGNHGVALVPGAGRGFISDGKAGSVIVFDLKDYKVLGKIKAAEDADAIVYDPASNKVLVGCGDAGKLVPIAADVDPKNGKAEPAIDLGGKPEFLAVDGQGKAYVDVEDKDVVAVVDTKTLKVVDRWKVAPGGKPVGMSIDPVHRRLFVGCRDPQKLVVMDADSGKVLTSLPIGAGVDATAFDDGYVLSSCRDGSLAVARETSPDAFEPEQPVQTQFGSRTMGVDPTTHAVYLPAADFETPAGKGRPKMKPGTFKVLVVERKGA